MKDTVSAYPKHDDFCNILFLDHTDNDKYLLAYKYITQIYEKEDNIRRIIDRKKILYITRERIMTMLFFESKDIKLKPVGACLLLVDLTDSRSLEKAKNGLDWVAQSCGSLASIVVVATKTDLTKEHKITKEMLGNFAAQYGITGTLIMSVEANQNVNDRFFTISKMPSSEKSIDKIQTYLKQKENIEKAYDSFLSPFFGGISKKNKIAAANALKAVLEGKAEPTLLKQYQKALMQGKLGEIYKEYQSSQHKTAQILKSTGM